MIRSLVFGAILCAVPSDMASSQTLMTSAANLRLRSAPGTESSVLAMLPLGTELELSASIRHGEWIAVRSAHGREGWINGTFAVQISDSTYNQVLREVIASRLHREGDGFVAREELVALIERALERDWTVEERASLELQRLRALEHALQKIPFRRAAWDDRLTSWVERREGEIRYNEPGGHWLIDRAVVLDGHDRYRDTAASDDLAWFIVQNGLPGECEGFLVCYVNWSDELEGEYLRREPAGKFVEEASTRVEGVIEYYRSTSDRSDMFDAEHDCAALHSSVASLEAAVRNSSAHRRVPIGDGLRAMLTLCP